MPLMLCLMVIVWAHTSYYFWVLLTPFATVAIHNPFLCSPDYDPKCSLLQGRVPKLTRPGKESTHVWLFVASTLITNLYKSEMNPIYIYIYNL